MHAETDTAQTCISSAYKYTNGKRHISCVYTQQVETKGANQLPIDTAVVETCLSAAYRQRGKERSISAAHRHNKKDATCISAVNKHNEYG
jgi:hypothetical protein